MSKPVRMFHIQTLSDERWKDFTTEPLYDEGEANEQLAEVQKFAATIGKPADACRLRELPEDEIKRYLINKYPRAIEEYVLSLSLFHIIGITDAEEWR